MAVGLLSGVRAAVGWRKGKVQPPRPPCLCSGEISHPVLGQPDGSGQGRPGLSPREAVPAMEGAP